MNVVNSGKHPPAPYTLGFAFLLAAGLLSPGALADPLPSSRKNQGIVKPQRPNPCAVHGPGFVQAAGSTTCIKVGGKVRFETDIGRGGDTFRTR